MGPCSNPMYVSVFFAGEAMASISIGEKSNISILLTIQNGEKRPIIKYNHDGLKSNVHPGLSNASILKKLFDKGLLANFAGNKVLRFLPPLLVSKEEIDEAMALVADTLAECAG